jgi:putative FmdB family regulatory protein
MPLFDFKCRDCGSKNEHFVFTGGQNPACPNCGSKEYVRAFGKFRVNVEYANTTEYLEKKLNPEIKDLYAQIGREALNEDSKTLDNIFGETRVRDTYGESDD